MSGKPKSKAPVVAVLNMKGGVGKTTIAAHIFGPLFQDKGVSTLLLDLDPQFNLTQTLYEQSAYETLKANQKTIFRVLEPAPVMGLFGTTNSPSPPPSVNDVCDVLDGEGTDRLAIVPGDFELTRYTLMGDPRKANAVRDRFLQFIDQARMEFNLICIDCNPSSSLLTVCALLPCTHLLVPVSADRYSEQGLRILTQFMEGLPLLVRKPEIRILFNKVARGAPTSEEEKKIRGDAEMGAWVMTARVYESDLLNATSFTGFATDKPRPYRNKLKGNLKAVADELVVWLGLTP